MDNTDITYEKIVEVIRNTSPKMEHPEELSQTILEKINHSSDNKRINNLIRITSIIAGVAASFLVCLICLNYSDPFGNKQSKTELSAYQSDVKLTETKGINQVLFQNNNNISEQIHSFSDLIRIKQENKIRKAQFYNILDNHNK